MKKFLNFSLSFYVLFAIICIVLINYLFTAYSKNFLIVSPLPDFLTYFKNKEVATINLWIPALRDKLGLNEINVSAKSALVYDLTTNKTIYSKNSNMRLPMASLTKIMTAVIALENKKANDQYDVTQNDLVGEDSMGLTVGEKLSLNELLYGLILTSGNDAAETLASNFTGGKPSFIKAMNDKTSSLGLKDTNFTNPTGLEGDGVQYTTAHDLLIITKYAISKFPTFDDVVSTFNYQIYETASHKAYFLENETNLLTSYPGVKGVKTGYTPEAGLCLVTYLDYEGHKIIAVLLGSDNRRGEMIELLDYALRSQGIKPPSHT